MLPVPLMEQAARHPFMTVISLIAGETPVLPRLEHAQSHMVAKLSSLFVSRRSHWSSPSSPNKVGYALIDAATGRLANSALHTKHSATGPQLVIRSFSAYRTNLTSGIICESCSLSRVPFVEPRLPG